MICRILIVAVTALAAVGFTGAAAHAAGSGAGPRIETPREPSTKAAVQRALTEFRSGLRHSDGELACSRMTLALRREILGIIAREAHVSGIGCETLIDVHGRELYEPHGGREIRTVAFRGDRARVCTTTGGRASFAREHGRWRLAHADTGRC